MKEKTKKCNDCEEIKVEFLGGESRIGRETVNYMLAKATDAEGEEIELYAEVKASVMKQKIEGDFNENDFDDYSYPLLKADIIKQAEENDIDVSRLKFYWD